MTLRVALAEDSLVVREGLEALLGAGGHLQVTASCTDITSLGLAIAVDPPDVVVVDIRLPEGDDAGIDFAARLGATHPGIGVVVLSQYAEPAYALRLFAGGSSGRAYLLKERVGDRAALVRAIESVADGGTVVDPKIVTLLSSAASRAEESPLSGVSPREREVLMALAEGKSNAAIADQLGLTKRAVEKHINALFLKLGLTYSPEAHQISKRVVAALMALSESARGSTPLR